MIRACRRIAGGTRWGSRCGHRDMGTWMCGDGLKSVPTPFASKRGRTSRSGQTERPRRREPVGLTPDYRITLARHRLESRPVEHRDLAAAVLDDLERLQLPGSFRDAFPSYAQHVRDELLRHLQLV